MKPCWINPNGYDLEKDTTESVKAGRTIYDFHEHLMNGLAFFTGTSKLHPQDQHTDLGSIPEPFDHIPYLHRDTWPRSYVFHDYCCAYGGLWSGEIFIKMTREQADDLLYIMVKEEAILLGHEQAGKWTAPFIWMGVRIGAYFGKGIHDGTETSRYKIKRAK